MSARRVLALSTLLGAGIAAAAIPSAQGATGAIFTVAGDGRAGFGGDGGAATSARLRNPTDVAALPDGGFLVADTGNNRIRRISATGLITTVAGDGTLGFGGDGGPATAAQLTAPNGVAALPDGGFLIADTGNDRVRRVSPEGVTLVLRRGTRRVARLTDNATAGRNSIDVPLPGAGSLTITLTARGAGQVATDGAPLRVRS